MAVINQGHSVWPGGNEVRAGEVPVALGFKWMRLGSSDVLLEQRVGLSFALRPGERMLMTPELHPFGGGHKRMPPGDYEVHIDLVQDGVTWFAMRGAVPTRLSVKVVDETATER